MDGIQGQFYGEWDIDTEGGEVTVTYEDDPTGDGYDGKGALVSYWVDDPTFQKNEQIKYGETKCRHKLWDSETDERDRTDKSGSLTVSLPDPASGSGVPEPPE